TVLGLPRPAGLAGPRTGGSVVAAQDREDAEQLDVDPDDRDGEPERGPPRLALRKAGGDPPLDVVEVEDQHQDTEAETDEARHEPPPAEAVDADAVTEDAEHEVEQRHRDEAEHRRDHPGAEPLPHLDVEELVRRERAGDCSEGADDRTDDEAGVAGLRVTEGT